MVEAGNNWRVERGLISPEVAAQACLEVAKLATLMSVGPARLIYGYPVTSGRKISGFQCIVEPLGESGSDSIRQHPELTGEIPTLMRLYDDSCQATGSAMKGFGINILRRGGFVNKHRDGPATPSRAITLEGVSWVQIEDPVTDLRHSFTLGQGDGFTLDNPADFSMHPFHFVKNAGKSQRTAFVI